MKTDGTKQEEQQNRAGTDETLLKLERLAAGYGGVPLLEDICLHVKRGEILTLIGPNGAGKSTILKSITGQLRRLGGSVYLIGQDIDTMTRKQIAETLSAVMTQHARTEYMTCREVVSMGRYPYTGSLGILSEKDWRKVDEALLRVRADEVADKDFMAVSDGQKQRVMLARALCQEPEVLILDEPTSYLDIRYKLELLSAIRELAAEEGLAVVLSLHELDLAKKVSDTIACVKNGGIERIGTPEEIFRGDYISGLYDVEKGSFEPLLGLPELARVEGEARVFVIGGGGTAVDTYYRLQRQRVPFAAGILSANDLEYPIAGALAAEVFVTHPYEPPEEELLQQAMQRIKRCESVLCTLPEFGQYNIFNRKLLEYAISEGKTEALR
ncbi:MAG: ABC transporter ATP-binding protein [Lachnospiraceae bacterium]|nr:ABC transporter ATP-binding protein [Lachnospiraceae bacterium]